MYVYVVNSIHYTDYMYYVTIALEVILEPHSLYDDIFLFSATPSKRYTRLPVCLKTRTKVVH